MNIFPQIVSIHASRIRSHVFIAPFFEHVCMLFALPFRSCTNTVIRLRRFGGICWLLLQQRTGYRTLAQTLIFLFTCLVSHVLWRGDRMAISMVDSFQSSSLICRRNICKGELRYSIYENTSLIFICRKSVNTLKIHFRALAVVRFDF